MGESTQGLHRVLELLGVAAIQAVRTLAGQIAPLLFVNEIRTVAADQLWLGPAYGTDAVGIHFTWKPHEAAVRAFLPTLEAALPQTARPHWGKVFTLDGAEVRSRYERWDDFAALAARFDPERRLVNPYLERLGV